MDRACGAMAGPAAATGACGAMVGVETIGVVIGTDRTGACGAGTVGAEAKSGVQAAGAAGVGWTGILAVSAGTVGAGVGMTAVGASADTGGITAVVAGADVVMGAAGAEGMAWRMTRSAAAVSAPSMLRMVRAASATASPPAATPRRPSADATWPASRSSATLTPMSRRVAAGCLARWTAADRSSPTVCAYASTEALTAGAEATVVKAAAGIGVGRFVGSPEDP